MLGFFGDVLGAFSRIVWPHDECVTGSRRELRSCSPPCAAPSVNSVAAAWASWRRAAPPRHRISLPHRRSLRPIPRSWQPCVIGWRSPNRQCCPASGSRQHPRWSSCSPAINRAIFFPKLHRSRDQGTARPAKELQNRVLASRSSQLRDSSIRRKGTQDFPWRFRHHRATGCPPWAPGLSERGKALRLG
jgi:hypothetical protein